MPNVQRITPIFTLPLCAALFGFLGSAANQSCLLASDESAAGAQIYKTHCAACHGASGEGSPDGYSNPLIGDRSVLELTRLIDKTMPEGEPEILDAQQSHQVAAYIHEAFYSSTAQARIKPARVELSRLTVRQYQNAVTDLLGSFRNGSEKWDKQRGLKAEYYRNRRFNRNDRVLERIDAYVNFDFGTESPAADKIEAHEFSIRWEGSLLAPETGDYELIVRTEHAARLYLNDSRKPLIDAWVKSGSDTEFRASIRLLGGRTYPLKLEFSKAKQGVDDSAKNKDKPKPEIPASIVLEWKLPQRVAEPIPSRNLSPKRAAELFVLHAAFPPDDRSVGYERGTSISKAWDQATTDAAIETAGYIATKLREFTGAETSADNRTRKYQEFCAKFVERAFRRPLSDEQKQLYIERQFAEAKTPELAVTRVVLLTLKSPRFLYREANATSTEPYDVASRLSFGLWDSLPDQELLRAAAAGQLATRDQVATQAERMLDDVRTRSKLREFFIQWLNVDRILDLAKDPSQYAEFDDAVASDLRTSLELFVEEVVWSEESDFRDLLLADSLPMNSRLAKFYGAELPENSDFQPVALNADQRSGVLTHPYLLAGFAYTSTSSPIHRGVFISRSLLGRALRPPPEAVSPLAPDVHASLTTRERIALQTQAESCMSCHAMINPLGFTLENYDAVGRFRAEEKGKPIDPAGMYLTRGGEEVKFAGARELAKFLAESDETHTAFVQQLFHYLVKQPIRAYGAEQLPQLAQSFAQNDYHIRKLVAEIVTASALPSPKTNP